MSKIICFKFNHQSRMKHMHKTKNQSMNVSLFHISEHTCTKLNDWKKPHRRKVLPQQSGVN